MQKQLTSAQMATVRTELNAQREGQRGTADIQTRIAAARYRYGYNPRYTRPVRVVIGIIGVLCIIVDAVRRGV